MSARSSWRVFRHTVVLTPEPRPGKPLALAEWTELEPLETLTGGTTPTPQNIGERYGEGRFLLVSGSTAVQLEIEACLREGSGGRMTEVVPDWKPDRRIKDDGALAAARLRWRECAGCGRPGHNGHHVLPKGSPWHGDDVEANIVVICGSGSWRCHGALHGAPYVSEHDGIRWTQQAVREAVGRFLLAHRPDTIEYVLTKLGWTPGREYLRTAYYLDLPPNYAEPA